MRKMKKNYITLKNYDEKDWKHYITLQIPIKKMGRTIQHLPVSMKKIRNTKVKIAHNF